MAKKKQKKPKPSKNVMEAEKYEWESDEKALGRFALRPELQSALTLNEYNKSLSTFDLAGVTEALQDEIEAVKKGELSRLEGMLVSQAHTLDAIFNNLARRAINAELMPQLESYLKLGLRAQSQSRATLQTLAEIKNPSNVAFVKQANIASGPQQVNNQTGGQQPSSCAGENKNAPNKLLSEQGYGPQMDFGGESKAGGSDKALEAVGDGNRAENG